jgi:N-carbamoylputrescine amidase
MKTTVAAAQFASTPDRAANLATADRLVREAAKQGANVVLIQELFETPYFCKEHNPDYFALALPIAENPAVRRFRDLARKLNVVLPTSVFERAGNAFYNTVAMIDADGSVLGTYRKAHIPESPGYHEKFYFSPGDTGFKVWPTRFGTLGVAICWDQWFPESARAMAVMGAEILFYPTAIGSEPQDPSIDSRDHWQRAMQGHSASNIMPLVASNRIGTEQGERWRVTYYGSSFITDHTGAILKQAGRDGEAILTQTFDLDAIRSYRNAWGVFRDRRPELYGPIMTLDGQEKARRPLPARTEPDRYDGSDQ